MQLDLTETSLPVYEALASPVRLQIIQLLSGQPMSVQNLAEHLGLSSAIITKHLRKLETAGLIQSKRVGHQKISSLHVDTIEVKFPQAIYPDFKVHQTTIPVGHYTEYSVHPSCGLAGPDGYIGKVGAKGGG